MRRSFFVFFVFFLSFSTISYSQIEKVDSLKEVLNSNISDSSKLLVLEDIVIFYSSSSSDSAEYYILQALSLSNTFPNKTKYVEILLLANKISRQSGNYEAAITYGYSALNVADSINNQHLIAQASKNIGISHYRLKNFEQALEFHNKALDLYIILDETLFQADCYTNIGVVYDETMEFDKALEYYNKALVIFEQQEELSGMADIYNNIAGIYYQKKEEDKMIEYMNKSLEIRRQLDDKIGLIYTLINIGGVYGQIGEYQKGIDNIKEGIELSIQIDLLPLVNVGYETMYELYLKQDDYKNAFEYYELYNQTKDSLFNIEKTKSIQELQTEYETEKQKSEIQELNYKNLKSENAKKRFILVIFSLIAIAALVIVFLMQRIKMNKILQDKNVQLQSLNATQNRLMSIISHDFKAPLSAFYSITNSLKNKYDKIDRHEIDKYFNRMLNSSVALKLQLENMLNWAINQSREITVSKKQINLHIISFKVVMILQEFANEKNILIENNIDENIEIETDSKLLSIVLNNLISNAIKFSNPNNKVIISTKKEAEKVILSVKDFGLGMSKQDKENLFTHTDKITQNENSGTGLGLIVSKDIVEKLGGKIWVESELKVGTEFFVEI